MSSGFDLVRPLPGAAFGGRLVATIAGGARGLIEAAEREPGALPRALADCRGLMLIPGMAAMAEAPELLLRLSRIFGPEVENYRENLTPLNMVHPTVAEIFMVSNTPPANRPPPALPSPPLVYALMTHITQPRFVYVHEWTKGDLAIWDNRCLVRAATWFDADKLGRAMWRTTVSGNPGPAYAGEAKSWIAA